MRLCVNRLGALLFAVAMQCSQCIFAGPYIDDVTADRAMYPSGSNVTINVELLNTTGSGFSGSVHVSIRHLGVEIAALPVQALSLGVGSQATKVFTWLPPAADFKGYLVLVSVKDGSDAVVDTGGTAIDVSSDWKRFPRYGYVAHFGVGLDADEVVGQLSRYHINGLEFYDWQWKHHVPYKPEPATTWPDIANRTISRATVDSLINAAHDRGMMAMNYNLYGGAYADYLTDGSGATLSMGIFDKAKPGGGYTLSDQLGHNLPGGWATSKIYTMNNRDPDWQSYIFGREQEVFDHFGFDGWHIDSLGYGTVWDHDGNSFNLQDHYPGFINNAKAALDRRLVYNSVDAGGEDLIAGSADVDFIYSELWGGNANYIDFKTRVDHVRSYGSKAVVFPAYMNYAKTSGFFNEASVRLADAAIFACGAAHLELGDGDEMLRTEYFPENTVKMSASLKKVLRGYYDFLVAYENLLRDESVSADLPAGITGVNTSTDASTGTVWVVSRKTLGFRMLHFINLLNNTSTEWRDADGTYPPPSVMTNLAVKMYHDGEIAGGKLRWASPDSDHGAADELAFSSGSDGGGTFITFTLPRLEYWSMVWLELNGTNQASDTIEAEAYDSMAGIGTQSTSDVGGGENVGFVANTDGDSYVAYHKIDFGIGTGIVTARVASDVSGGSIEFRLDRVDGPLIGTVAIGNTGGWQSWVSKTASVSGASGLHDLYLVFRDAESNLNWFRFASEGASAVDRADNAVYENGWQNGDNGGTGFGGWMFGGNIGGSRAGIASSLNNGGGSSIDTSDKAFYLSNTDASYLVLDVSRHLNADLQEGEVFSLDMDINWRNGHKGINVFDADDTASIFKFEIGDQGSGDDHVVMNAATGNGSIGSSWSDNTQFHIELEQTSPSGGVWKITRSGGISDFDQGTYAGAVSSFQLYFDATELDSANSGDDIFYNNLAVSLIPGFDYLGAWTNRYDLNGADAELHADPDLDLMDNLFEYAVGGNPTLADAAAVKPVWGPAAGESSNSFVYAFRRRTDAAARGLVYRVETTEDLMNPAWSTNECIQLDPVQDGVGFETSTNLVATSNATLFLSLQIELL